jgi:guanylate kinase
VRISVHGQQYVLVRDQVMQGHAAGKICLLNQGVEGVAQLVALAAAKPDSLQLCVVWVACPSHTEQARRLTLRGDTDAARAIRLATTIAEEAYLAAHPSYFIACVISATLARAVDEIKTLCAKVFV